MDNLKRPPENIIWMVLAVSHQMDCELCWLAAEEVTRQLVGTTANDNCEPPDAPPPAPSHRRIWWINCIGSQLSVVGGPLNQMPLHPLHC